MAKLRALAATIVAMAVLAHSASPGNGISISGGFSGPVMANATIAGDFGVSGSLNFSMDLKTEVVAYSYILYNLDQAAQAGGNASMQFLYQIHTNPVPPDGNCDGTLGQLDPFNITEAVVCDQRNPQFCQEGDLSGRHGTLDPASGNAGLVGDKFLRFWPEPVSLFGRSIVIHYANKTRIACGNITSYIDGTQDQNGTPTNKSSSYVTNYPDARPTGPPGPVAISFTTSRGSTIAIADATQLPALPNVEQVPNGVLTTNSNTPTFSPVSSSFVYSDQPISAFPTQSESAFPSASASGGSNSGSSGGGSGGGSGSGSDASPSTWQESGAGRQSVVGLMAGSVLGGAVLVVFMM